MKAITRVLATASLLLAGAPASASILYDVKDLGALAGNSSYAYSINDAGEVVGYTKGIGDPRAFLYDGVGISHLGTFPATTPATAMPVTSTTRGR